MIPISIILWWYGLGWKRVARQSLERVASMSRFFSAGTLFRTLFAPWRQIISSGNNQSIDAKMRAAIDNVISRFVGFIVRTLTLVASLVTSSFLVVVGVMLVMVWPLIPLLVLAALLYGLGVF